MWRALRSFLPRSILGGRRLESVLESPTIKSVVEVNSRLYDLAQDPEYAPVMTARSHLTFKVPLPRRMFL